MKGVLSTLALCVCVPALALRIDGTDMGISKRIPAVGDRVTWSVPVHNPGEIPFDGPVTLTMRVARIGEPFPSPVSRTRAVVIEPGGGADILFTWTPERNGYYRVEFALPAEDERSTRVVAVTERDVRFVWFGAPKDFRWCNIPTTVKPENRDWWLRRGAIPAAWKGGVCYKEWPVERFVESWGASDWIAIDEVGGPGKQTDTFIEAWRRLKEKKPEQWTAVWFMGAHPYWREIKDLIDLFVPEIYLNYRGNHLGQFDAYLTIARQAGVIDQLVPGLGINQIKDKKTGRVTNSPTRADVLRQVRYLKRTAPELPGIGFFTSNGAAWGVAEYADRLCEEYYIKPVLTVVNLQGRGDNGERPAPASDRLEVQVANVGGMDAEDVELEWRRGWSSGEARLRREMVRAWPVGTTRTFRFDPPAEVGWYPVEFRIVPKPRYTVLDGEWRKYVVRLPPEFADSIPVVIPPGVPAAITSMRWTEVGDARPASGLELGPSLRPLARFPVALLPPRPGLAENLAAFSLAARVDRPRLALLRRVGDFPSPGPESTRDGDVLRVSNAFYEARLDLSSDRIVSLTIPGDGTNILASPWELRGVEWGESVETDIQALPGCTIVTVRHDAETASGETQYAFFARSPAIRIARLWIPKGRVRLKTAADRCGLAQRGGSFALQPGVGGPVRRGRLHDGRTYRDLLFGYLGSRPAADNAARAGWIDLSFGPPGSGAGLGVAIDYRWRDSESKTYDVTRLYDAGDWLEVLYLWGKEKTFSRAQRSCIYLIPHEPLDLTDPAVLPPAMQLWRRLHREQLVWAE